MSSVNETTIRLNGAQGSAEVPDRAAGDRTVRVRVEGGVSTFEFDAGLSTRSRVFLDYSAADAPVELTTHFRLAAGACVEVYHLHDKTSGRSTLRSAHEYRLKKHASLTVLSLVRGEQAEIGHDIRFEEPHGFASIRGLAVLGRDSRVIQRVIADHSVGQCISRQFFKSIVADRALSEFDSLVQVARGASQSDSKQLNKNLLLSRTAKAISRPQLRIDTDDVACAHGAATGELDENELFYLRSRGLSERTARSMITEGFAEEILGEVGDAELRERLTAVVRETVGEVVSE